MVIDAIKDRRSTRRFDPEPLSPGVLEQLLEAARWAPSAGNRQPWHFYAVKDERKKLELVEAAGGQDFIAEAPVVVVVCADPERSAKRYGDRGRDLYCIQDTAAAIQNILLAAEERDLGTCWIGAFDEGACARVLDLTDQHRPVAMIPIGAKGMRPKPTSRRDLDEVVTYL